MNNNTRPLLAKRRRETLYNSGKYILLCLATFFFLLPIMWFMTSAFRTNEEVFANLNPFSISKMFFGSYSLDSYKNLFSEFKFYRPLLNSILVCFLTVIWGVLIGSLAGYAFAKMQFRGRKLMFLLVIFAIMVPFDAIAIPLYSIITKLRWVDTYQALILPTLANGMVIFMFRQFFIDINDSLIESAALDGAGDFTIFFRIILPLSKPTIISGALVMFMAQWNAFMWPLLSARSPNLKMVQVAMADFRLEHATMWSEMFGAMTLAMLIPCLILLPFQKYYIRGIATSGMKE